MNQLIHMYLWVIATVTLCGTLAAEDVDFHTATAQDLQIALIRTAANGASNNIYLTNGYRIKSRNSHD